MKIYDYIPVGLITNYPGWNIEGTFPAHDKVQDDYVIVSKTEAIVPIKIKTEDED